MSEQVVYEGRAIPMVDGKPSYEVTRAVAILNVAAQVGMAPVGGMPESDADKLIAAERIMLMTQQAMAIANTVGRSNVPQWDAIERLWWEGTVMVGANGASAEHPEAPQGGQPSSPSPAPAPQQSDPTSSSAPVHTQPAPPSTPVEQSPSAPSTPETIAPSAAPTASSAAPLSPPQPSGDPNLASGAVWSDVGKGLWTIEKDLGDFGLEVRSHATNEVTVVPRSFLAKCEVAPPPPGPPDVARLVAEPSTNSLYFFHDGCTSWVCPLDDVSLERVGEQVECANCAHMLEIVSVEDNGYVSPHEKEDTSTPPSITQQSPAQPPSSPPPSPTSPPSSSPTGGGGSGSSTSSSAPTSSSTSPRGDVVDDDEGDEAYRKVLDEVERDWNPTGMPIPHGIDAPLEYPDDITADLLYNRRLHGERNALSAVARRLFGMENAKAKGCGRVRKAHFKRAFADARSQLGASAAVTDVRELAEQDEQVVLWDGRIEEHSSKAAAYKTFLDNYLEDVKTLSRDLTWAGAEEQGST